LDVKDVELLRPCSTTDVSLFRQIATVLRQELWCLSKQRGLLRFSFQPFPGALLLACALAHRLTHQGPARRRLTAVALQIFGSHSPNPWWRLSWRMPSGPDLAPVDGRRLGVGGWASIAKASRRWIPLAALAVALGRFRV
jgi:hypothetical protein